uniref:Uncharacterized protein n=1 Tax=Nelumbo nucifera TaxID=4432 RepID=A0A822YK27_NELNU|nr:TPA_asm: hypothetical protein HUJ06_010117 [Nelumbo nucifera]
MTDMPLEIGAVNPKSNVSEQEPMGEGKKPEFNGDQSSTKISNDDTKRPREGSESEEEDEISKKQKIEKLVEEECLDKLQQNEEEEEVKEAEKEEEKKTEPVSVGPKNFSSSEEIFNYFYKFLHCWPPNVNVNQVFFLLNFRLWILWSFRFPYQFYHFISASIRNQSSQSTTYEYLNECILF